MALGLMAPPATATERIYHEAIFSGNIDKFRDFRKSLEMCVYLSRYSAASLNSEHIWIGT